MRFTQFGHQVPRRNSTIAGPRCNKSASEKLPARFAALSVKSGALSPILRVSVVVFSANDFVPELIAAQRTRKYAGSKQLDWIPQARDVDLFWMSSRAVRPERAFESGSPAPGLPDCADFAQSGMAVSADVAGCWGDRQLAKRTRGRAPSKRRCCGCWGGTDLLLL